MEQLRGVERDRVLAATDGTGSAVRQGRPRGGPGRAKIGYSFENVGGPSGYSTHPRPRRCHRPCFAVRVICRETNAGIQATERLNHSVRRNSKTAHLRIPSVSAVPRTSAQEKRNMNNGALDKKDEEMFSTYQYIDNPTYMSEQRVCRFPHLPSSRGITEVADGSAHQAWCEQRVRRVPPSLENRGSTGFPDSHQSPN